MATRQLGIKLEKLSPPPPPPPPAVTDLTVTNITSKAATLNFPVTTSANRVYGVVVPQGSGAPSATQIKNGQNSSGTSATWAGNGKFYNIGVDSVLWFEGPSGLAVSTAYTAYVVEEKTSGSNGTVYDADFTTLAGGPELVSTSPSIGYNLASLTANITMTFDQPVIAGTGSFVLRNTTDNTDVETFNIATGVGSAGGSISISSATVTINPNASLTARKAYAITVPSTAIKNTAGTLSYAGISNYTTFYFKAKYSTSNADKIAAAEASVLAFALDDDSCKIVNALDATDNYNSTFTGKFTVTGSPDLGEYGGRFTTSVYATLATSLFNYSNTVGTLILYGSAQDSQGSGNGTGTGGVQNSMAGFYTSSTTGTASSHYLHLSKGDTSSRNSNLQAVYRNEAGVTDYKEVIPGGLFPKGGAYKAIGMTWNSSELIVGDGTYFATDSSWTMPDDFLLFRIGPISSELYFDVRYGFYIPVKKTQAELQTYLNNFVSFVTA